MTVYVDDMYLYPIGEFRNMKMSHLIADTTDELLAMVRKIGVQPKWIQYPGTPREHFDIAMTKRNAALAAGAVAITLRQCGAMEARRQATGKLGDPADAEAWLFDYMAAKRAAEAATATYHHDYDDDAVCTHCGFDGAEWHHLQKSALEPSGEKPPLCTREWPSRKGAAR